MKLLFKLYQTSQTVLQRAPALLCLLFGHAPHNEGPFDHAAMPDWDKLVCAQCGTKGAIWKKLYIVVWSPLFRKD